jgi:LysM repeat protein
MRYAGMGALLIAWATTAFVDAHATTVFPKEQKCPVCCETFITTAIGSYSSYGEPARDLSDSSFARFGGVEVCPYCLFSALKPDFKTLPAKECSALRSQMPPSCVSVQEPERAALRASSDNAWLRGKDFFGHLLARHCSAWRKQDSQRDQRLLRHLYYATNVQGCEDLHRYYRKECITALTSLLASRAYEDGEQAVFTYLLGELTRLDGRHQEAVRIFGDAARLAKALPRAKGGDDKSYEWVGEWAFEQTCRIQFLTNSVPELAAYMNAPESSMNAPESRQDEPDSKRERARTVALQMLAARQDPEAWAALATYVMQDPWRLEALASLTRLTADELKRDGRLWAWVEQRYQEALRRTEKSGQDADLIWVRTRNRFRRLFDESEWEFDGSERDAKTLAAAFTNHVPACTVRRYEVQPGDTLTSIGAKQGLSVERLLDLNPAIKNMDKLTPPMGVQYLTMPYEWPEERVLINLSRLLHAGDTHAISFFLSWAETVGERSFEQSYCRIAENLSALSKVTSAWRVPPQDRLATNRQQELIHDCLALIHGGPAAGPKIIRRLEAGKQAEVAVVLACLEAIESPQAKDVVFDRLRKGYDADFDAPALGYLTAVATTNDLPALKKIAMARCPALKGDRSQHMNGFKRQDVEAAMLRIRLRDVVKRSIGQ